MPRIPRANNKGWNVFLCSGEDTQLTFYRLPMVLMRFSFSVYVCVFSFNMFHLSYPIISKQRNWIWSGKISILPITSRSTPHAWFFSSSLLLLPIIYLLISRLQSLSIPFNLSVPICLSVSGCLWHKSDTTYKSNTDLLVILEIMKTRYNCIHCMLLWQPASSRQDCILECNVELLLQD